MQHHITLLATLLRAPLTTLHAAGNPAGKAYIYKESAGQLLSMEVYSPPNHDAPKPECRA
jgi:hypothetical protein